MTNYKEVLRLYLTGDYSQRDIAKALSMSRNTIRYCISKYQELNLSAFEMEEMTDAELKVLMTKKKEGRTSSFLMPSFGEISSELKKPNVTKKLLWKEYLETCKGTGLKPYSISQFNALLEDYLVSNKISIRRDRTPGDVLELDWSGSSIELASAFGNQTIKCHLFVAALPFSGYFYAEAFADEKIHSWITGVVNSLNYFGGVPKILKPDNCKTATIKADKYEPELNKAMQELGEYYRTAVIPARVRKPKDKNVVESSVGFATHNIIAALRNQVFYDIRELNKEIAKRVKELNNEEFQKKDGTRFLLFQDVEKSTLLPLPLEPFHLFERTTVKVAPDYHIQFDKCFYSVHPKYIGKELKVKASVNEVIILTQEGEEIARHQRCRFKGQKSTNPNHIPPAHQYVFSWSGEKFKEEAQNIGPNTVMLVEKVLASREFEVQSYNTCRGILNLRKKYGRDSIEHVAKEAVDSNIVSYKSFKALLDIYIEEAYEMPAEENLDSQFFITRYNLKKGGTNNDDRK